VPLGSAPLGNDAATMRAAGIGSGWDLPGDAQCVWCSPHPPETCCVLALVPAAQIPHAQHRAPNPSGD